MEASATINSTAPAQPSTAGFHAGHFALMAGSALVLLVLGVAQSPTFSKADSFAQKYSGGNLYANVDRNELPSPDLTQYALNYQRVQQGLNPVNPDGSEYAYAGSPTASAVLGASTYDESIPQKFASLSIVTASDNSAAAVQSYTDQVAVVLSNENVVRGTSAAQLKKAAADLQAIAVPSSIEDYHRLLVETFLLRASGDPQNVLAQIEPVMETIRSSVQGSVNVTLPTGN